MGSDAPLRALALRLQEHGKSVTLALRATARNSNFFAIGSQFEEKVATEIHVLLLAATKLHDTLHPMATRQKFER